MIMTKDTISNVSTESEKASEITVTKQRKRRKWDQPADPLVAISVPLNTSGFFGSSHPLTAYTLLPQNAMEIIQKLNQPKVQEEIIAREILINDVEPNLRHKLTKRQTQDEIMKNTGAVVITRGKYQAKGSLSNGEKPLYLHISANSHNLAERIRAVDKAASMVEEIIRQSQINQVVQPLTMCVCLGFDADPSLNIANRIRGPNDQYINHIMNETGATVTLKGHISTDSCHSQGSVEPLHMYISSTNPKSLEAARILAENLLETISIECGASRVQSSKTYIAIPPPPQLVPVLPVQLAPAIPVVPPAVPVVTSAYLPPAVLTSGTCYSASSPPPQLVSVQLAPDVPMVPSAYLLPTVLTSRTRYRGYYQGIYPAGVTESPAGITEMTAGVTATQVGPSKAVVDSSFSVSDNLVNKDKNGKVLNKKSMQKRKFQELPVSISNDSTLKYQNLLQGSEFCKPGSEELSPDSHSRKTNMNMMPPPKKLVELGANGIAPRVSNQIMPPPPPKFTSVESPPKFEKPNVLSSNSDGKCKLPAGPASDTLLKLVEYGEEEDDDDVTEI